MYQTFFLKRHEVKVGSRSVCSKPPSSYQGFEITINECILFIGDGFTAYENNSFFSTYDRIHDTCNNSPSGPQPHGGGWWFDCLQQGNLNGAKYYHGQQTSFADGLSWYPWHEYNQSMKTTIMMIKNN
jgi:hypothetical protein